MSQLNRHAIDALRARRLALARAGLLRPELTGLHTGAGRGETVQRARALAVVRRFGYLQLDTVSIAGARSHVLVLLARMRGFRPEWGERLLQPGEPLFEYWGHEASWIPIEHYGLFGFRRAAFRRSPWWRGIMDEHGALARQIVRRIRADGPLRSSDLEGRDHGPWWEHRPAKRVVVALWSSGNLAVRERASFQRSYDLPERVIPESSLRQRVPRRDAIRTLLLLGLDGHGWATTATLAATWRLRNNRPDIERALRRLVDAGQIVPCDLHLDAHARVSGWIQPHDLEVAEQLARTRPRCDAGVLLSPFDPVLWDRARVSQLFGFHQILEIFKPAPQRRYGYFCLPVLAGDTLVARVDLKADSARRKVAVLSTRFEATGTSRASRSVDAAAARRALLRHAEALGAGLVGAPAG